MRPTSLFSPLVCLLSITVPWAVVACDDDSSTSTGGSGGEAGETSSGGAPAPKGGSKATAGEASGGAPSATGGAPESTAGMPAVGGETGAGGAAALCADVDCPYGQECSAGECLDACEDGNVLCNGTCINPASNESFCGAAVPCDGGRGANPQTPPVGAGNEGGSGNEGGAGGAGSVELPRVESAGENCAVGFSCQQGSCTYDGLAPGDTAPQLRGGYAAECREWLGNVCMRPWIQIPLTAVVNPTPENICIDDASMPRPIWYYDDGIVEASTFCWVATGSSAFRSVEVDAVPSDECGWMYGTFAENNAETITCDGFRKYSEVDSPGDIPNAIWSFDLTTAEGCRGGVFTAIECYWPEAEVPPI